MIELAETLTDMIDIADWALLEKMEGQYSTSCYGRKSRNRKIKNSKN